MSAGRADGDSIGRGVTHEMPRGTVSMGVRSAEETEVVDAQAGACSVRDDVARDHVPARRSTDACRARVVVMAEQVPLAGLSRP